MSRAIRIYPDPVLRKPTAEIKSIDDAVRSLAREMVTTMYEAKGAGLAAPQVGESIQLAVVDVGDRRDGSEVLVLINPRIVETEGKMTEEEGCLSIPDFTAKISRDARIRVTAQNPDGEKIDLTAEGIFARALQHEIDHLAGILFVDRLSPVQKMFFNRWARRHAAV